ncbi:Holliday junction resolvasome, DNA-binding subunit [Levilactobacillus namurensis DSM 19117]|uniref:Holliday junction branch migration complex subunit RuvA n=1 Tax=Levilactobacillus namurensis DSM 19117 TaxID=1423773 RepID=A0A0R1JZS9_9LACO|nr:Holliday junction branch migration protein RuvA [Levilactobacillus namurensis]KRK76677.1 Holliday junction resolvasome, DNA-binding subunit [Levilactobacillus namurensis DSM 19117]GEO74552.1 Holliday junction ATP-dependent DNA helicase RuvA [Levilactobacillus namurensis]HJE45054.1 Holliday junction branch migration protein RuvA [Levilactobacillus namurensis]
MYEYLRGTVAAVTPDHIVVDVNGVGYLVNTANPYRYTEDQTVTIYVYQAVSDTAQTLYGFADFAEKQLFLKLINVSGIGPKSALAILANPDHDGLMMAIKTNDVSFLTKFPGVGKKTAGQLVLDLQGKLDDLTPAASSQLFEPEAVATGEGNPQLDDCLAALAALGYREAAIKKITPQLRQFAGQSTNDYLSEGLRLLTK